MIVLYLSLFICLITLLTPLSILIRLEEKFWTHWGLRDELCMGEQLLSWLDSLGLGEVGFNLNIELPHKKIFRHYGHMVHELWEEVRSQGGQLRPLLQILRKELRSELLGVKKEREYLKGAYAQVLMMIGLVYFYLVMFSRLIEIPFPNFFWPLVALFQSFGVFLFFVFLKGLKKRHFQGLRFLSSSLMQLKLISQRGNLGQFVLRHPESSLKGNQMAFYRRLEQTLDQWKRDSRIQIQYLNELEDDLQFIRDTVGERFMSQLKITCFLWSLVFVLPLLFGASLFGLYELTVV